jgi:hypothetical protein
MWQFEQISGAGRSRAKNCARDIRGNSSARENQ